MNPEKFFAALNPPPPRAHRPEHGGAALNDVHVHVPSLAIQQEATLDVALELTRLDHRLAQIAASIPLPADVDEMFEDRCAATPASHLYGVVGAVKVDLRDAIEALREAAQADEVMLRRVHRRLEREREKARRHANSQPSPADGGGESLRE